MIKIYYGPTSSFEKIIPSKEITTLTKLLTDLELKNKQFRITTNQDSVNFDSESYIENLVVSTEEYSRLSESGINAFVSILNETKINNMYFQNPPKIVYEQLDRYYENVEVEEHIYSKISEKDVKQFVDNFSENILGQDSCKTKISNCLYKIAKGYNNKKPLVLLLYGPAGVGKTETAKFLCSILEQELFRKQFSMYQNYSFADYVFGSNHNSSSLARDLLDREVMLFYLMSLINLVIFFIALFIKCLMKVFLLIRIIMYICRIA